MLDPLAPANKRVLVSTKEGGTGVDDFEHETIIKTVITYSALLRIIFIAVNNCGAKVIKYLNHKLFNVFRFG